MDYKKKSEDKAKSRRDKAKENKALYEVRKAVPEPLSRASEYYRGLRRPLSIDETAPNTTPAANKKGEFLVGPLKGGESLLYMRAKRAAIKKAQEKKKKNG